MTCVSVLKRTRLKSIGWAQGAQQSLQSLVAALQLFPLHGERGVEQNDDGLRSASLARALSAVDAVPKPEQRFGFKEAWLVRAADGGSFGGRRLAADGIAVSQDLQRVRRGGIQIVRDDEVFAEIDVLPFEVACDEVRRVLLESAAERFWLAPGSCGWRAP